MELCGEAGTAGALISLLIVSTGRRVSDSVLPIGATVISAASGSFFVAENVRNVRPQPREADNHVLSFNRSKNRSTEMC